MDTELTDEQLAVKAQADDDSMEELINRYRAMVKAQARAYFFVRGDNEDLLQEGMMGLFKAIRDFKPEKQVKFKTFATLCIERQLITAIKQYNRNKNVPLNTSLSLDDDVQDCTPLVDVFTGKGVVDPEEVAIDNDMKKLLHERVRKVLTQNEWRVLCLYLGAYSYADIAKNMQTTVKTVDNCLQRIKKKLSNVKEGMYE